MRALRLYLVQRVSAAVMAPLALLHLGLICYAVQGGLDAEEILGRTRGSFFWAFVYGLFVISASAHASIGLANILREWTSLGRVAAACIAHAFGLIALVAGLRAVHAVTF